VGGGLRRADDGLAMEIERGVQDRRDAGSVLEFCDQLRVAAAAVYELRSRRLVRRVKGGDQIFASLFCRPERDHHVVCRDSFWIADVTVGVVFQDAGRERHPEVAVFYLRVQLPDEPLLRGMGEDAPVPQCPRAELHASVEPGYDLALRQQL